MKGASSTYMSPVESILQFVVQVFLLGGGGGGGGAGVCTAEMETAPSQSEASSNPTWKAAFADGVDSVIVPLMPFNHVVTCHV